MRDITKLKPCPFCGSNAEIIVAHGVKTKGEKLPLAIVCSNRDCAVNMGNYYGKDNAIAAWNRRENQSTERYKCETAR